MDETHRFFVAPAEVYESIRLQLDAAWGHGPGTGTVTCYTPVSQVPVDSGGMVRLAVRNEFCDYSLARDLLPGLLELGVVQEITRQNYLEQLQATPPQA